MRIARAHWASGSFLIYLGGLLALFGAIAWLQVISGSRGAGAFAGWSVLFWAVAEVVALWLLIAERRVTAGIFAVVGLGLWGVMVGAFFSWWGWLSDKSGPFSGFHVGDLALVLLILLAAIVDIKIWRFPFLALPLAVATWFFVTDLVSNGGNWSTVVTLLLGLLFFLVALGVDGSDSRPYGFWWHVVAGLLVGGAFLTWWHSSTAQWAGIIVVSLIFILTGAGIRRSSYAVLGALGLILATGHFTVSEMVPVFGGGDGEPTTWAGPVGFTCLGVFLALLGTGIYRTRTETV